ILQICCGILKKDDISIDDNFFEAGGNSLNAVRLVSRIQKELNIELALKEIFYNPVLRAIAEKAKKSITIYRPDEQAVSDIYIAPASEEELNLLCNLQFDDEE
ncbi:MAG: phosphopantetheine-binding protein, partial [Syntrophothermus sp.]